MLMKYRFYLLSLPGSLTILIVVLSLTGEHWVYFPKFTLAFLTHSIVFVWNYSAFRLFYYCESNFALRTCTVNVYTTPCNIRCTLKWWLWLFGIALVLWRQCCQIAILNPMRRRILQAGVTYLNNTSSKEYHHKKIALFHQESAQFMWDFSHSPNVVYVGLRT